MVNLHAWPLQGIGQLEDAEAEEATSNPAVAPQVNAADFVDVATFELSADIACRQASMPNAPVIQACMCTSYAHIGAHA